MRDWKVRSPSRNAAPIDWDAPEPPPRPRTDHVQTPWGEMYSRQPGGLYAGPGRLLSWDALLDKIERFHGRWQTLRPGRHFRVFGAELLVLWANGDGSYRSGRCAATGPKSGSWMIERGTVWQARHAAEVLWMRADTPPPIVITADEVAKRLGV